MSAVVWFVITVVLFTGNFACLFYSGWQVFAPFRFRRIRVIWLVSESLRAKAGTWYWRAIFILSATSCIGISFDYAGRMVNRSALITYGMTIILIGDLLALAGVSVVVYYDRRARAARRRELESTATIC